MSFKKINAWFHLWFGLVSGIIVFILGITGCILVFEQEIKSISSPWLHAAAAGRSLLPPSDLYKAAARALPDKKVESIWYHGEGYTAHVSLNSDLVVYVNPYNAKVIAIRDPKDIFEFVEKGHFYVWLPKKIGHQVVSWGTMVFFILLISGLIMWWPKKWNKRERDQSFKIKWSAKLKRVNYDLHNVLGFYVILLAVLFAFTGLMMSFPWFNNTVYKLAGGLEKPRSKVFSDTSLNQQSNMLIQVDKAWHKGINEIAEHDAKNIIVNFPAKASDAIYVCTDMYKGTWRDVYLDQHTLEQLPAAAPRLRDEELAGWIRRSNYGLHVGAIGGLFTKFIYFFGSLICASLPLTGFYIWFGKRKKKSMRSRKINEGLKRGRNNRKFLLNRALKNG